MTGPGDDERCRLEAESRWRDVYEPELVAKLRWDGRYSIVRIGGDEFAFSDHDLYVAALRAAWDAGLVPDHGPGLVPGIDLPDVAPSLRDVDMDSTSNDSSGRGGER
jgi:hypothetical protein